MGAPHPSAARGEARNILNDAKIRNLPHWSAALPMATCIPWHETFEHDSTQSGKDPENIDLTRTYFGV
ncbi:hypothetical protein JCM31598_33720 [Desulfonatronum parangueonense]